MGEPRAMTTDTGMQPLEPGEVVHPGVGIGSGDSFRRVGPSVAQRKTVLAWISIKMDSTIVQADTVVRWHRAGFKLFWRWKSRTGQVWEDISGLRGCPGDSPL